jgi:hypothetical protein
MFLVRLRYQEEVVGMVVGPNGSGISRADDKRKDKYGDSALRQAQGRMTAKAKAGPPASRKDDNSGGPRDSKGHSLIECPFVRFVEFFIGGGF